MASGLFSISRSALLAHQQVLQTIGQNIANAETPGYSRQEAVLSANAPVRMSYGMVGPMAGAMDALGHEEVALRRTIVAAIVGFAGGGSPRAVMDNIRRGCGTGVRPNAKELDEMLKAVDAAK